MKRLAHVTAVTVFCVAPLFDGFWPIVVGFWFLLLLALFANDDAQFVENLSDIVFHEEVLWAVWTVAMERAEKPEGTP